MFHDEDRIPIFDLIERFGLGSGDFSDNRQLCALDKRGGIQELALKREKPALGALPVRRRPLIPIELQLQELNLRAFFQAFDLEDLAAEYHHPSLQRLRCSRELDKRHLPVNQRLQRFRNHPLGSTPPDDETHEQ